MEADHCRLHGHCQHGLQSWYRIGINPNFTSTDDPSFFPFPGATNRSDDGAPTHVYKWTPAGLANDAMRPGMYKAGAVNQTSQWLPLFETQTVDAGKCCAAGKDFFDPVKQRRIYFCSVCAMPNGALSLPRVVSWDPAIQQLLFSPLEEQER